MLALIAARAAQRLELMREVIARDSDPEDLLAEFSRRYASQAVAERDWSAAVVEFMVVVGRDEELRARYAEHHDASREAIAAAIRGLLERTGGRLAISPRQLATAMMSLNIGLTVEGLLAPGEVTRDLYVDAQLALRRGATAGPEQR